jgi:hypothetical protein
MLGRILVGSLLAASHCGAGDGDSAMRQRPSEVVLPFGRRRRILPAQPSVGGAPWKPPQHRLVSQAPSARPVGAGFSRCHQPPASGCHARGTNNCDHADQSRWLAFALGNPWRRRRGSSPCPNRASLAIMRRLGIRLHRDVHYPLENGSNTGLARGDPGPRPPPALRAID